MEELENFKKKWNDDPKLAENYSKQELFAMTKNRTKSLGKKLFIIGSIEVFLWALFAYIDDDYNVYRIVLFFFFWILIIFQYYKITNNNNTLSLMKSIRNLRFIVLVYAVISIVMISVDLIGNGEIYTKDIMEGNRQAVIETRTGSTSLDNYKVLQPSEGNYFFYGLVASLFIMILIRIYKATYGKVLQELNKNYKELIEGN